MIIFIPGDMKIWEYWTTLLANVVRTFAVNTNDQMETSDIL